MSNTITDMRTLIRYLEAPDHYVLPQNDVQLLLICAEDKYKEKTRNESANIEVLCSLDRIQGGRQTVGRRAVAHTARLLAPFVFHTPYRSRRASQ
jgi:hypothetical protein